VTVTLVGVGTSPMHPIVDRGGSFNYAINQDHEFFAGVLPTGVYTIRASDAAGASAQARFEVT
jgi:DNA-binding beta-propeller fold protein YncE